MLQSPNKFLSDNGLYVSEHSLKHLMENIMAWEKVTVSRANHLKTIMVLTDGQLRFSQAFIQEENLENYEYVELFVDKDLRRIGIKFSEVETSIKLTRRNNNIKISSRALKNYPWVKDLLELPTTDRRFLVEIDESIPEPTAGVRYYISLGYRFYPKRDFNKQKDYPRFSGVYRLFKEGQIVRIGESNNLETRLKEHWRNHKDEVDEYDFCEIQDSTTRKRQEKELLEAYKDAYARLPKLNSITA